MCYAIITNQEFPPVITIQAKRRIDEWQDGDTARGGVAVRGNVTYGQGYTFLVHNMDGTIQFLNDWVKADNIPGESASGIGFRCT